MGTHMTETHSIEKQGLLILMEYLQKAGRAVEKSKRKTFDLVVDGLPAEVKCKKASWGKVDFISLTQTQKAALDAGETFLLFVVCNLLSEPEIIEIQSERLKSAEFVVESTHYIYGSQLRLIDGRACCQENADER